ncbi:MAG TPA: hypothetical protein VNT04_00850 [Gaiellaceae bacterium]|nr:hypothetical protein [Gaiellaceae bacterium]
MGRAPAVLRTPRAAAFAVLAVLLGLYYRFHASLPDTSTWGDVAFIGAVLMPAVLLLVYLLLPLQQARELQLLLLGLAFAVLAVLLHQANLDALSDFSKLAAMAFLAWWFLNYFEDLAWVVLVACIVPWVDAYSVWRGPTNDIVHNHRQVFTTLSFAFPVPGENSAANLGLPDLLFFSLFLGAAARFGLRVFPTWVALAASFGATIALAVGWDKAGLPALPLLSLGFLLVNADLIWERLRRPSSSS